MPANQPTYLERLLRFPAGASAHLIARELADANGVTVPALRSASRREPLPEVRRLVARKAHRLGVTQAHIAAALNVHPSRVSRLIGGAV